MVLQYLGGHDVVRDIRQSLPSDWPKHNSTDYFPPDEPWEEHLGPFWCGTLQVELKSSGQVRVRVFDDREPPARWQDDVTEEMVADHERQARQRRLATAEVAVPAFRRRGLQLTREDGKPADVTDLATGTVIVSRPAQRSAFPQAG